jgi:hypothetical protein
MANSWDYPDNGVDGSINNCKNCSDKNYRFLKTTDM